MGSPCAWRDPCGGEICACDEQSVLKIWALLQSTALSNIKEGARCTCWMSRTVGRSILVHRLATARA